MDEMHRSTLEESRASKAPVGGHEASALGTGPRSKRLPVHDAAAENDESFCCYVCTLCGWPYDEYLGLPDHGIPERTRWQNVPDSFVCPECGVGKELFRRDS